MKFDSDFQRAIFVSSVLLKEIGPDKLPKRLGSGCLIDYEGKRILLTVSHTTKNQGKWCMELRYEPGKGTSLYSLGAMNFLAKGSLASTSLEDIDFSYVEVPASLQPKRQEILSAIEIGEEIPVTVHRLDFHVKPSADSRYGFCGAVMPSLEKHPSDTLLVAELKIYEGLSYLRNEDDYYVFKLPMPHPGHEHFHGTSGAPVIDDEGRVVALVCSGCVETDEIFAISVARYRSVLDILVGKIK
jgi:hypothetical protein